MKKTWLYIMPLLIFVGFVIMLYARLGKDPNVMVGNQGVRNLPAFNLPRLDNNAPVSIDDLPKEAVLLNVWGSWCPTCHVEHPFLMSIKDIVPMIGINYKDERQSALAYLQKGGNPFVWSAQDKDGNFALDLGLTGAPETFIVKDGKIYLHILGEINQDNFDARILPCVQDLNTNASVPRCQ